MPTKRVPRLAPAVYIQFVLTYGVTVCEKWESAGGKERGRMTSPQPFLFRPHEGPGFLFFCLVVSIDGTWCVYPEGIPSESSHQRKINDKRSIGINFETRVRIRNRLGVIVKKCRVECACVWMPQANSETTDKSQRRSIDIIDSMSVARRHPSKTTQHLVCCVPHQLEVCIKCCWMSDWALFQFLMPFFFEKTKTNAGVCKTHRSQSIHTEDRDHHSV